MFIVKKLRFNVVVKNFYLKIYIFLGIIIVDSHTFKFGW